MKKLITLLILCILPICAMEIDKEESLLRSFIRKRDCENVKRVLKRAEDKNFLASLLRSQGYDEDRTPLMDAVLHGTKEIVEVLVEAGADVNAYNFLGWTALTFAAQHEFIDISIARFLIEKDASINVHDNILHFTPLIWASKSGQSDMVKLLVEKNVSLDQVDNNGLTALMWAVKEREYATVLLLLKSGASVNSVENKGKSALMFAAQKGFFNIASLLLWYGADIDRVNNRGVSALMYATRKGHRDVVKMFLEEGASVNIQYGWKALIKDAMRRDQALVRVFVEKIDQILTETESVEISEKLDRQIKEALNEVKCKRSKRLEILHEFRPLLKHAQKLPESTKEIIRRIGVKFLSQKNERLFKEQIKFFRKFGW